MMLIGLLATIARSAANPVPAVSLVWDASTDPTVSGYNVYYGSGSRNYTNVVAVGNATSVIVSNLANGVTYYFAATTYNVDGIESVYSAEASYAVPVGNLPPTLDALTNLSLSQDDGEQVVSLTGITSGATNESQTLTVSAFSSNPGLIPNPVVTYASPETNGTLTFTPAPSSFGSAIITVMVDDGASISNTVIRTFTVTVNPIVNPPTIDLPPNLVIAENAGEQTVNLTGISSGTTNGTPSLTLVAVSSNPSLIPNPTVSYTSPAETATLAFAPATNAFGSAVITISVSDNEASNNVTSVSFNVIVNQTVPIAGLLTNAVVAPNTTFRFLIKPPVANGDKFNIGLAAGAPAGARIATTKKGAPWLIWTPTFSQASSTNLIGIKITDQSNASLSTNETVQVIVLDYLALTVGTTSIQAGQSGSVVLALASSDGVTNLSFALPWPTNSLPSPTLSVSAAGVGSSSLRYLSNSVVISLQMAPGQSLQGSNIIGSLNFQSLASQPSGYINLPINNLSALKPSSLAYADPIPTSGQIAVINNLAMLQAAAAPGTLSLTALAKVGNSYQVQYCTNFGPGSVWYNLLTYSQTNISQIVPVNPTLPHAFYRLQQK